MRSQNFFLNGVNYRNFDRDRYPGGGWQRHPPTSWRGVAAIAAPVGCSAGGSHGQVDDQAEARRNLNVARFIDPIAPNLPQASAQTLAPVPPGELRQNP